MKTVLAALNAKYVHTGLGIRSVAAYARSRGLHTILWERTINHRPRQLLRELVELAADVMVFSCYIWNIELVRELAADLRQIRPDLVLAAAGPEVSYHSEAFLVRNPAFDAVLAGEGEAVTAGWLAALARNPGRPPAPAVHRGEPVHLDALPFPYPDLPDLGGRILYYETMRGCPFRCSYCLSSIETGPVRFRSLALVFADFEQFLAAGARQVKLVDRTFNCDRARALAIWTWLRDHDNGVTGFHFELAGELLDNEACALLATLRPGLVQFEIGVQSTNSETLAAIRRPADTGRLFALVDKLRQPGNIHLHLDLIAGLPHEDYASFGRSFNAVYRHRPHQLQLGFLKVLGGSAMEQDAAQYGILYRDKAPYEVMRTGWLSFGELCRLQGIADMVDLYYNSGRFTCLLADMVAEFASPFAFYEALWAYYRASGHDSAPPGKVGYYEILGGFLVHSGLGATARRQWLCRYDMALHEKIKKVPAWVEVDGFAPHRTRILAFLATGDNQARYLPSLAGKDPKRAVKIAHAEVFPFHPETGAPGEHLLLFDYGQRDVDERAGVLFVAL